VNDPRETLPAPLAASDAVFAWCLRGALRAERDGDPERAALWAYVAAGTGIFYGHSRLCSPALEALAGRLGRSIADAHPAVADGSRRRWLHVFSETLAIGGHTALARRWIAADDSRDLHSVVATMQPRDAIEARIAATAAATGGEVLSVAHERRLVDRAARLRALAREHADVVVVHAHQWDVVPSLAFATPAAPPVLLMNHADHAFWIGTRIADVVVDIRDSGRALSQRFRGARRSTLLPIPLDDRGAAPPDRTLAARRLGDRTLSEAESVLLTIGSGYKYRSVEDLDFPQALERIVDELPRAIAIAVGPEPSDPVWQRMHSRSGGRIRAIGPDPDLAPWHAAADLYLEGFPIGSYTAMLEAALAQRPIVRKPLLAPPSELPVDRGALARFEPPATPAAYVEQALSLARDPGQRSQLAKQARDDVLAVHCGDAWRASLAALRDTVPPTHEPVDVDDVPLLTEGLARYWATFHGVPRAESALAFAMRTAEAQGLRARTDVALADALRALERRGTA
jgi:hypothetical protein